MVVAQVTRRWVLLWFVLPWAMGCMGVRGGALPAYEYVSPGGIRPAEEGAVLVDYSVHFVGRDPAGRKAFEERVRHVFARHPLLAHARPGDGDAPKHLALTLYDRTNRLVAGLTGLAAGLTLTVLPAYARDDFELDVEVRAGSKLLRRAAYRDAVSTVVHCSLAFAPKASTPRVVVEAVVDNMLLHALRDLDASGLL